MRALRLAVEVAQLGLILLAQIVASGVTTAWMIVSPRQRPRGAVVRMTYRGLSPTGATVLASMIAVTPGTTPVDIDHERGEMWIHFLDASSAEAAIASIHARLEFRLRRVFPSSGAADG
jgi:multisubunit Na+/H+ antiporter MnhE subunit